MKLEDFTGEYTPEDFINYNLFYDNCQECDLRWTKTKLDTYDSLAVYIMENFWTEPYESFLLTCEVKFGIAENFFKDVFSYDTGDLDSYILYSSFFYTDDEDKNIASEFIRRITDTELFDKAIKYKSRGFFNFAYDFFDSVDYHHDIMQAYFLKESKINSYERSIFV